MGKRRRGGRDLNGILLLDKSQGVTSNGALQMAKKMFAAAKDKTIGRAEALKRSMVAFMSTPQKSYLAHPMFWAPFSIVGEGG